MVLTKSSPDNRVKLQLPALKSDAIFRSLGKLGCVRVRQRGRNVVFQGPNGRHVPLPQRNQKVVGIGRLMKALETLGISRQDFLEQL